MTDPRLIDALLRYEEMQEKGEAITPEELCADCPELVGEVRRRLLKLKEFSPLPTPHDDGSATLIPGGAESKTPPVIPGYEILGILGEGGMGVVFQARHITLNRIVALKIITAKHASAEDIARFQREVEITARLEHPGVVPVYSLMEDNQGLPCYAMRLIEGESLQVTTNRFHAAATSPADIGQKRLALRQLLTHFLGVCNTIAYAHSRGVIHRDLKPANVMVGKYGEVMVVDWGLGKVIGRAGAERTVEEATMRLKSSLHGPETTVPGDTIGTPAFMSPEQSLGQDVGHVSDVYSLGATLYYLLTNQAPFRGAKSHEVMTNVQAGRFPPPHEVKSDVPPQLESMCLKAMARLPADRYASARAMAQDVENWLADEQVSTYVEPWNQRLQRWSRRRQTLVTTMIVSLFLVMAGLAAGIYVWHLGVQKNLEADLKTEHAVAAAKQESQARLSNLQTSSEVNERIANAELLAGHFESAHKNLQAAVSVLEDHAPLADRKSQLQARRDRLERVVQFYHLSNEAERAVAERRYYDPDDKVALENLRKALQGLGVFKHANWYDHLPDEDLSPGHREQLRSDVYREMMLFAGLQAQGGLIKFGSPQVQQSYRDSLETVARLEHYKPSLTARFMEVFCRYGLGEPDKLKPLTIREPTSAADYHYVGMLHVWLAMEPDDPITRFFLSTAALILPLDPITPQTTAERYLITAANMEPHQYWTQYWLGTTFLAGKKYQSAEAVFNICVASRPHYRVGYGGRGLAIQAQVIHNKDAVQKKLAADRGLAGLTMAIRLNPTAGWSHGIRGIAYTFLREHDLALADLNKAIELEPSEPQYLVERARVYVGKRLHGPALSDYTSAVKAYTNHPELSIVYAERGETHRLVGDLDRALQDLNESLRIESNSFMPANSQWICNRRGLVHIQLKKYEEARADFTLAIKQDKQSIFLSNRASCNLALKNLDLALPDLNEALRLNKQNDDAYYYRSRYYFERKQYDKGLADSVEAVRLAPKRGRNYAARGDCQRALGHADKAAAAYYQAVLLQAHDDALPGLDALLQHGGALPLASYARGLARLARKEYAAALADFADDPGRDSKVAMRLFHLSRGRAYLGLGQFEKSEADFDEMIRLGVLRTGHGGIQPAGLGRQSTGPDEPQVFASTIAFGHPTFWSLASALACSQRDGNTQALMDRGLARAAQQKYAEAAADLAFVQQANPNLSAAWFQLALVRLAQKDIAAYRDVCTSMLKHVEANPAPDQAHMAARVCLLDADTPAPAATIVKHAELAAAAFPRNATILTTLGAAYGRDGKLISANQRLTDAIALANPEEKTRAYLQRALVNVKLGQKNEALADLDHAFRSEKEAPPEIRFWPIQFERTLLRSELESQRRN